MPIGFVIKLASDVATTLGLKLFEHGARATPHVASRAGHAIAHGAKTAAPHVGRAAAKTASVAGRAIVTAAPHVGRFAMKAGSKVTGYVWTQSGHVAKHTANFLLSRVARGGIRFK